jgi:hypothetical protein
MSDKLTKELQCKDNIISELRDVAYRLRENVIEEQEKVRKLRATSYTLKMLLNIIKHTKMLFYYTYKTNFKNKIDF